MARALGLPRPESAPSRVRPLPHAPRRLWPRGLRLRLPVTVGGRLLLVAILSAISMFPLIYMVAVSFAPPADIFTIPPVIIPPHPIVSNYVQAWTENSFGQYFLNSVYVSLGTVFLTVVVSALTAYGFARYEFWGKNVLFYYMLSALAVPGVLLIMPQYLLMKDLGLLDSRLGLILLYTASNVPFNTFLLRNFFQGVPRELEEAMRLDGVSEWGLLPRLVLPLSVPAIITVGMFTFNGAWDEYPLALTMINTPWKRTLPIAIALFQGTHTTAWGPMFAAMTIATVPHIIVFGLAQRWFQEGMSVSVPT